MKFDISEKQTFEKPCIEEGVYEAVFKEFKPISDSDDGKKRAVLIYDLPSEKIELGQIVNIYDTITEGSNFGQVVIALGLELKLGMSIDTDSLVGLKCKVFVENYDADGKEASIVKKAKPINSTDALPEETITTM